MALQPKNVPERDDTEFRGLVERPRRVSKFPHTHRNYQATSPPVSSFFVPVDPLPEAINSRRAPYVSFGEQGTTATASAYGSLLRTCRPINELYGLNGFPNSRMVGLEFTDIKPWFISGRANYILENAHDANCGFGLKIRNDLSSDRPTVEFMDARWPVIKYSTKEGFLVTVRLWCQHGIVVQHMHVTNSNIVTGEKPEELRIDFDPNFTMQDLDYLMEKNNEPTRHYKGINDHGIIVMQRPDLGDGYGDGILCETQEVVCVLVGIFKNGASQELNWNHADDEQKAQSRVQPIHMTHALGCNESVEFSAAFKIHTATLRTHWRRFMISSEDVIFDPHPLTIVNTPISTLDDMSWYLYRNLEHIMSACSVPLDLDFLKERGLKAGYREKNFGPTITLTSPGGEDNILSRAEPIARPIEPIALTCGDFGDHRVSMLGSYYSFMFMLNMHTHWSITKEVRQRIYEICTGHLQWVSQLDTRAASSSNIWIDGRNATLSDADDLIDLPPDSSISMPSHIIKATEYLKVFSDTSDLAFVCGWLYGFSLRWLDQLIKTKNHATPTWQHSPGSNLPKYRLSDQIWIWKALKSLEELVIRVEQAQKTASDDNMEHFLDIKKILYSRRTGVLKPPERLSLDFDSDVLRNENIRRFTLFNDVAKSHMLSVTRSARETRFLLHDKDTVLYYGLEWGFFDKSEKYWTTLVQNQTEHDKDCNDESQWNSPLRYGLATEMAKHGHQFDSDFPASKMAVHAKRILLNSSSETGLFPGNLNNEKEPAIFEHEAFRDFYFHSGFEIPYILLRCESNTMTRTGPAAEDGIADSEEIAPASSSRPVPTRPLPKSPTKAREPRSLSRPRDNISPTRGAMIDGPFHDDLEFRAKFQALGMSRTLKRQNPYGRLVDFSNIVEIPEEWLYKYPDFLDYVPRRIKVRYGESRGKPLPLFDMRNILVNTQRQNGALANAMSECMIFARAKNIKNGRMRRRSQPLHINSIVTFGTNCEKGAVPRKAKSD